MSQTSGIFISNSSNFGDVPRPSGNNLSYFLNINAGNALYAMKANGAVFPIITQTMRIHTTVLNQSQIINLDTKNLVVLPEAISGYANLIYTITEDYFKAANPVFGGNTTLSYREAGVTAGQDLFSDDSFVITGASKKYVAGSVSSLPGNPVVIKGALKIRSPFSVTGGNVASTLTVSVAYQSIKIDI